MRALLNEKKREKAKLLMRTWLTLTMIFGMTMTCYASSYSENAAKWGLGELSWLILFAAILVAAGAWVKRSTSGMIIAIIVGAILWYICQHPTVIGDIGNKVGPIIFN